MPHLHTGREYTEERVDRKLWHALGKLRSLGFPQIAIEYEYATSREEREQQDSGFEYVSRRRACVEICEADGIQLKIRVAQGNLGRFLYPTDFMPVWPDILAKSGRAPGIDTGQTGRLVFQDILEEPYAAPTFKATDLHAVHVRAAREPF
jgi:hypothetical protein